MQHIMLAQAILFRRIAWYFTLWIYKLRSLSYFGLVCKIHSGWWPWQQQQQGIFPNMQEMVESFSEQLAIFESKNTIRLQERRIRSGTQSRKWKQKLYFSLLLLSDRQTTYGNVTMVIHIATNVFGYQPNCFEVIRRGNRRDSFSCVYP